MEEGNQKKLGQMQQREFIVTNTGIVLSGCLVRVATPEETYLLCSQATVMIDDTQPVLSFKIYTCGKCV